MNGDDVSNGPTEVVLEGDAFVVVPESYANNAKLSVRGDAVLVIYPVNATTEQIRQLILAASAAKRELTANRRYTF